MGLAPFEEGEHPVPAPPPAPCSKSRRDAGDRMGGTSQGVGSGPRPRPGTGPAASPCDAGGPGRGGWGWSPVSLTGVVPRQVISGLKQRVLRLEQQCKEKDSAIRCGAGGPGGPARGQLGARTRPAPSPASAPAAPPLPRPRPGLACHRGLSSGLLQTPPRSSALLPSLSSLPLLGRSAFSPDLL